MMTRELLNANRRLQKIEALGDLVREGGREQIALQKREVPERENVLKACELVSDAPRPKILLHGDPTPPALRR